MYSQYIPINTGLIRNNDANAQKRFHDILNRISGWDASTLHQYFNDTVNSLKISFINQIVTKVQASKRHHNPKSCGEIARY